MEDVGAPIALLRVALERAAQPGERRQIGRRFHRDQDIGVLRVGLGGGQRADHRDAQNFASAAGGKHEPVHALNQVGADGLLRDANDLAAGLPSSV